MNLSILLSVKPPYGHDLPNLESYSSEPSEEIIKIGQKIKRTKMFKSTGAIILGILSLLLTIDGGMGIYPLGGVIAAFVIGAKKAKPQQYDEVYKGYANLNRQWNTIRDLWKKEASADKFSLKLAELKEVKSKYFDIPNVRTTKLKQLEKDQRKRQLNEYLDGFYIYYSNIDNIGPSRKAVLQSYGIETAKDITKQSVLKVPGFGPYLTNNLVEWRKNIEKHFSFDPKKGVPKSDLYALEKEIFSLKSELENRLIKGESELNNIKTAILNKRVVLQKEAEQCVRELAQAKSNVNYLNNLL